MLFCPKCGQSLVDGTQFCTNCGAAIVYVTNNTFQSSVKASPQPAQQQASYTSPVLDSSNNIVVQTTSRPVSGGTKAKGFVGMGLSIESIFGSAIAFLYSIIAVSGYDYDVCLGFGIISIFFAIIHLAISIPGFALSNAARNSGFESGATTAGKVLGLISIILCSVSFFFSIVALSSC